MEDVFQDSFKATKVAQRRSQQRGQDVRATHGDDAVGDRNRCVTALARMSQRSLESRSAETGPDQPFYQWSTGTAELVQVGVRLPLFEEELYLPAQAIDVRDLTRRENGSRHVGYQRQILFPLTGPDQDHPQLQRFFFGSVPFHVEFETPARKPMYNVLQPPPRETLQATIRLADSDNVGIEIVLPADQEESSSPLDGFPVIEALVATVGEQELADQGLSGWQKASLRVFVGCDFDVDNLIVEDTQKGVDLDGSGTNGSETTTVSLRKASCTANELPSCTTISLKKSRPPPATGRKTLIDKFRKMSR